MAAVAALAVTWRFSLLGLWLLACASSKHSEIQIQQSKEVVSAATRHEVVTQSVQTGPETITTTVEEFATVPSAPVGDTAKAGLSPTGQAGGAPAQPQVGHFLVKRTTITDVRGPSLTESHSEGSSLVQAHAASSLNSKTTTATKTRVGLSPATKLALLCGVALAVLLAVKFKIWRVAL